MTMKAKVKPTGSKASNKRKTFAQRDITDPADIARFRLCLSERDLADIRALEEGLMAAEQEVGTLRFG